MVRSSQDDIDLFEERLGELCDDFIDNERLSETVVLKVLRERVKYYAPIRKKRMTQKQMLNYAMNMNDTDLNALPDDKKKIILDLREVVNARKK